MVSTQDLRNKEVINIYNGKSIGFVDDITLNLEKGTVEGIVIPQSGGGLFSFFSRGSEIIVPWHCIRRIGDEVVLVELRDGFEGGLDGERFGMGRAEERFSCGCGDPGNGEDEK